MLDKIRIATRQSPLALWQAEFVRKKLGNLNPEMGVEIIKMQTRGDKILDVPLSTVGGKGLFIKELEEGILQDKADIAVHSMKDVPVELPDGFVLAAICERENPFDAFVSNRHASINELPQGAKIGTSSLRRKSQLLGLRPDLVIEELRGNVNTRLNKLDNNEFDAIILAAAGLNRLGLEKRIKSSLPPDIMLPATGQGAIGIECLADSDAQIAVAGLNHEHTRREVSAERAFNRKLEGGCQAPIAGFARINGENLMMDALVGSLDGKRIIRAKAVDKPQDYVRLGNRLADELFGLGAREILAEILG